GGGMFILWRWQISVAVVTVTAAATLFFVADNESLGLEETLSNGGLLLPVVAVFMIILIQTRYRLTIREITASLALEESNGQLAKQNKQITDSIRYAQRIQDAILPSFKDITKALPESFVLFKPQSIVSGDFYWFWQNEDEGLILIAAVDCTGHGVPGAFMSMKGDALLSQIVNVEGIRQPHEILSQMHIGIQKGLQQKETKNRDGMDAAMCLIDTNSKIITFAGAKNPLVYIQNNEVKRIKGDKNAIGGYRAEANLNFTSYTISYHEAPITFYLFSDGYQDQFGGEESARKFGAKRFREMLFKIHDHAMGNQKDMLDKVFEDWKAAGEEKQIDDVLVIGVRVE
ncbi:MAG: SpoIIE family protein phosphatase, partial [Bacteroidota bacterium]